MLPVAVDFETEGIGPRPDEFPPKPVGVAIKWPGKRAQYYAWGHPTENNAEKSNVRGLLREAWKHPGGVVFHNASFDLAVAEAHFELPWPAWDRIHCTQILAFLHNPYSWRHGLKPLSEDLLEMPPEEQDMVKEWVLANVPEMRGRKKGWGGYICRAPGKLVGKYAKGDVDRTIKLWKFFSTERREMASAYDRERKLLPVLDRMSQYGIPVAKDTKAQAARVKGEQAKLDTWLRKRLGVPADFDLQKRKQLCDAIEAAGMLDEWIETAKGHRSLAHEDFGTVCVDPQFAQALHQRSLLGTIGTTFLGNWAALSRSDGRVHIGWHSTRGEGGGARTGRLSSSPNVQNISKQAPPESVVPGLWIPNLREVVVAPRGQRLVCADYAQQEPRMAAHRSGGGIAEQYRRDPLLDFHTNTQQALATIVGIDIDRTSAKTLGLAILYALGLQALSAKLGVDTQTANQLRRALKKALPDFARLERELKDAWEEGEPLITWGGRIVHAEGERWAYKALNYYCQGSSAEQTKDAMISYDEDPRREGHLILSVHDELAAQVATRAAKREAKLLVEHMEGVGPFNVPFKAEVGVGVNWWQAKP
jgi:DNA polymerase I-like protein with 3'-5' exonuclease and polymerase domains